MERYRYTTKGRVEGSNNINATWNENWKEMKKGEGGQTA